MAQIIIDINDKGEISSVEVKGTQTISPSDFMEKVVSKALAQAIVFVHENAEK